MKLLPPFLLALLYADELTRFSPESLTAFCLSVFIGVVGWIGFRSRSELIDWQVVLRTFSMGLFVAYVVDSICWAKGIDPELRAALVATSACFSEPILAHIYDSRQKILKRFFGNGTNSET